MNNTKIYRKLFSILIIIFVFGAWTKNLSSIKKEAKKIKSISSTFIQEKHIKNILKKPLISKGNLFYKAPGSLRWEYTKPSALASIVLMNDNELTKYIKRDNKFIKTSSRGVEAMQVVLKEISNWLNGEFEKSKNFKVKVVHSPRTAIVLTPTSKELSSIISKIELYPSKNPGVISSLKIIENKNSYTYLKFKKVKLNRTLEEKIFKEI